MNGSVQHLEARLFARLPDHLHYKGPPNAWVQMTRPGHDLHSFLEGPAFSEDGRLWLVDVPYGRIFTVSPSGDWALACEYDGEPHGLAFSDAGHLYVTDYRHGLLQIDSARNVISTLVSSADGEPLRGVADLAVARNGDIWITEPGRSSLSNPYGRLLKITAGTSDAVPVLTGLPYPNSVALSPDDRMVYVSMTRSNAIWRLAAHGAETPPMAGIHVQLSGGLGPDGLAVHPCGLLAVAQAQAGRAYVFNPVGDLIAQINMPQGLWTTAVRFAPDGKHMVIVEAQTGSIYSADIAPLISQSFSTERRS